jgi:fructokinase
MSVSFGIDLGGTKMEIVALDQDGQELLRQRQPTPRSSYDAMLDGMVQLVAEAERQLGVRGTVGVCHPGSMRT